MPMFSDLPSPNYTYNYPAFRGLSVTAKDLLDNLRNISIKHVKFNMFLKLIKFYTKIDVAPPGLQVNISPLGFSKEENPLLWNEWNEKLRSCSRSLMNMLKYHYGNEITNLSWLKNSLKREAVYVIVQEKQCNQCDACDLVEAWAESSVQYGLSNFTDLFYAHNAKSPEEKFLMKQLVNDFCQRLAFFRLNFCDLSNKNSEICLDQTLKRSCSLVSMNSIGPRNKCCKEYLKDATLDNYLGNTNHFETFKPLPRNHRCPKLSLTDLTQETYKDTCCRKKQEDLLMMERFVCSDKDYDRLGYQNNLFLNSSEKICDHAKALKLPALDEPTCPRQDIPCDFQHFGFSRNEDTTILGKTCNNVKSLHNLKSPISPIKDVCLSLNTPQCCCKSTNPKNTNYDSSCSYGQPDYDPFAMIPIDYVPHKNAFNSANVNENRKPDSYRQDQLFGDESFENLHYLAKNKIVSFKEPNYTSHFKQFLSSSTDYPHTEMQQSGVYNGSSFPASLSDYPESEMQQNGYYKGSSFPASAADYPKPGMQQNGVYNRSSYPASVADHPKSEMQQSGIYNGSSFPAFLSDYPESGMQQNGVYNRSSFPASLADYPESEMQQNDVYNGSSFPASLSYYPESEMQQNGVYNGSSFPASLADYPESEMQQNGYYKGSSYPASVADYPESEMQQNGYYKGSSYPASLSDYPESEVQQNGYYKGSSFPASLAYYPKPGMQQNGVYNGSSHPASVADYPEQEMQQTGYYKGSSFPESLSDYPESEMQQNDIYKNSRGLPIPGHEAFNDYDTNKVISPLNAFPNQNQEIEEEFIPFIDSLPTTTSRIPSSQTVSHHIGSPKLHTDFYGPYMNRFKNLNDIYTTGKDLQPQTITLSKNNIELQQPMSNKNQNIRMSSEPAVDQINESVVSKPHQKWPLLDSNQDKYTPMFSKQPFLKDKMGIEQINQYGPEKETKLLADDSFTDMKMKTKSNTNHDTNDSQPFKQNKDNISHQSHSHQRDPTKFDSFQKTKASNKKQLPYDPSNILMKSKNEDLTDFTRLKDLISVYEKASQNPNKTTTSKQKLQTNQVVEPININMKEEEEKTSTQNLSNDPSNDDDLINKTNSNLDKNHDRNENENKSDIKELKDDHNSFTSSKSDMLLDVDKSEKTKVSETIEKQSSEQKIKDDNNPSFISDSDNHTADNSSVKNISFRQLISKESLINKNESLEETSALESKIDFPPDQADNVLSHVELNVEENTPPLMSTSDAKTNRSDLNTLESNTSLKETYISIETKSSPSNFARVSNLAKNTSQSTAAEQNEFPQTYESTATVTSNASQQLISKPSISKKLTFSENKPDAIKSSVIQAKSVDVVDENISKVNVDNSSLNEMIQPSISKNLNQAFPENTTEAINRSKSSRESVDVVDPEKISLDLNNDAEQETTVYQKSESKLSLSNNKVLFNSNASDHENVSSNDVKSIPSTHKSLENMIDESIDNIVKNSKVFDEGNLSQHSITSKSAKSNGNVVDDKFNVQGITLKSQREDLYSTISNPATSEQQSVGENSYSAVEASVIKQASNILKYVKHDESETVEGDDSGGSTPTQNKVTSENDLAKDFENPSELDVTKTLDVPNNSIQVNDSSATKENITDRLSSNNESESKFSSSENTENLNTSNINDVKQKVLPAYFTEQKDSNHSIESTNLNQVNDNTGNDDDAKIENKELTSSNAVDSTNSKNAFNKETSRSTVNTEIKPSSSNNTEEKASKPVSDVPVPRNGSSKSNFSTTKQDAFTYPDSNLLFEFANDKNIDMLFFTPNDVFTLEGENDMSKKYFRIENHQIKSSKSSFERRKNRGKKKFLANEADQNEEKAVNLLKMYNDVGAHKKIHVSKHPSLKKCKSSFDKNVFFNSSQTDSLDQVLNKINFVKHRINKSLQSISQIQRKLSIEPSYSKSVGCLDEDMEIVKRAAARHQSVEDFRKIKTSNMISSRHRNIKQSTVFQPINLNAFDTSAVERRKVPNFREHGDTKLKRLIYHNEALNKPQSSKQMEYSMMSSQMTPSDLNSEAISTNIGSNDDVKHQPSTSQVISRANPSHIIITSEACCLLNNGFMSVASDVVDEVGPSGCHEKSGVSTSSHVPSISSKHFLVLAKSKKNTTKSSRENKRNFLFSIQTKKKKRKYVNMSWTNKQTAFKAKSRSTTGK